MTHSMAMPAHFGPHAPLRATGLPATIPIKVPAPRIAAGAAKPAVADAPAPKPIRASVEPAAIAGWVAGHRVRVQPNAVFLRSQSQRSGFDRKRGFQIPIPCVNHGLARVGVGDDLGTGFSIVQGHQVSAVGSGLCLDRAGLDEKHSHRQTRCRSDGYPTFRKTFSLRRGRDGMRRAVGWYYGFDFHISASVCRDVGTVGRRYGILIPGVNGPSTGSADHDQCDAHYRATGFSKRCLHVCTIAKSANLGYASLRKSSAFFRNCCELRGLLRR